MRIDNRTRFAAICLICMLALPGCSGCNRYQPPRTRNDIFNDQMSVEMLYFTDDGGEVLAPGTTRGMIVDASSGKLAHVAWQCDNPNCPGRQPDGKPYLFPLPDPFAYIDDKGEAAISQPAETQADLELFNDFIERKCPKCLEIRKRQSETKEEKQQYQAWATKHITPAAKQRLAELEVELREYMQRNQSSN